MPKYIFTRTNGPWDYPTLGFRANLNDVIEAPAAPDAWWEETDPAATVTIPVTPTGGIIEPPDGSVLVYRRSTNTQQFELLTADVVNGIQDTPAGRTALAAEPEMTAAFANKATEAVAASAQSTAAAAVPNTAPGRTALAGTAELNGAFASKATETTVTSGRLSEANLDASIGAAVAPKADKRSVRVAGRQRANAAPVKHMVHACAAGHGWVLQTDVSNNASSNLDDTSDFLIGSQSMRITTAGTSAFVGWDKTLAAPIDVSDCDVRIWFKFDSAGAANLANLQIILGDSTLTWRSTLTAFSAGSATSYTQWPLQEGRWNILDIPQGAAWTPTGTPNWAAVQRMLFKASDKAGLPLTVRFGGMAFTRRDHTGRFPNGVVTLSFDDSFAAQDSYARVKMDQYGYRGTLFPIIDRLGLPGKLTLAQVQKMYQNGWDVSGHAFTDANHAIGLPGMTQAQRLTELENIRAWMDTNAFQSPSFAYPLGNHDAASEADVAAYFDVGRLAFMQRDTPQAIAMPFALQAANAGTQQAALAGYVTRAVAGKHWLNIVVHDIVPSGATGNNITEANFDALLSSIASSGIAVRTMSEVLAALN